MPALRYASGLVATFLLIVSAKIRYEYFRLNVGMPISLDLALDLLPMIWVPLLMYFAGMLLASLSASIPAKAVRRAVLALTACAWLPCLAAIGASGSAEASLAYLLVCNRNILTPLSCLALFVPALLYVMLDGLDEEGARRPYAYVLLAGSADSDWPRIERSFRQERMYRDPDMDLGELSRMTGIPRNRISAAIRIKAGRNFPTYLNELRVREFLGIVRDPGYRGDFLSAAFEAGFNSKASFYSWFWRITNENPSGYLAASIGTRGIGRPAGGPPRAR